MPRTPTRHPDSLIGTTPASFSGGALLSVPGGPIEESHATSPLRKKRKDVTDSPAKRAASEAAAERARSQERQLRLAGAVSDSAVARAESQLADDKGLGSLELSLLKLGNAAPKAEALVRLCIKQIDARSFRQGRRLRAAVENLEALTLAEGEAHLAELQALAQRLIAEREVLLTCATEDLRMAELFGERSILALEAKVRALQADGERKDAVIRELAEQRDEARRRLAAEAEEGRVADERRAHEAAVLRDEASALETECMQQRRELASCVAVRQSCWLLSREVEGMRRALEDVSEAKAAEAAVHRNFAAASAAAAREHQRLSAAQLAASEAQHAATRTSLSLALREAQAGSDRFEAALRVAATDRWASLSRSPTRRALAGPGTRGSNDVGVGVGVGVRAGPGTRGSNDDDNDDHALLKAPHHLTATPVAAVAARSKAMAAFVSPTFAVPRPQRSPSSARRSTRRSASAGLLLGVRYGEGLGLHTITLAAAGAEPEDTDADNGLDGVRQLAPSSSLKHLMLVGEKAARSPDVPRWDLPER